MLLAPSEDILYQAIVEDQSGVRGIVLIALGLSILAFTYGFLRTPSSFPEKSYYGWTKPKLVAITMIFLVWFIAINTVEGHVGHVYDNYVEQIGMSFSDDYQRIDVNVTAVEQAGADGMGPGYLLNGWSNTGYWYQVGIVWYWGGPRLGCGLGFSAGFAVFAPNATEILPPPGTLYGGILTRTLDANQGDIVLLSMYFEAGQVVMYVHDWNTTRSFQESYPAFGGAYFQGTRDFPANPKGFFTGLMTEQYHRDVYYGGEQRVTYKWSRPSTAAWIWADELTYPGRTIVFVARYYGNYSSTPQLSLASNGSYSVATDHQFVTGQSDVNPPTRRLVCWFISLFQR